MTNSADLASCESADIQRRILELIEGASSIAISGHTSPDGDALGSVLGLGLSLMKFFPNKDIALLLADDDPVPRIYRFMEGSDRLVPASAYAGNPDLFISVDVPVVERLNNSAEVLRRSKHVVCFDHHPAREEFAELSLRRVDAAACAMIIDRFLDNCGIVARDGVATCLLCGLVTDTGRFQYFAPGGAWRQSGSCRTRGLSEHARRVFAPQVHCHGPYQDGRARARGV